MEWGEQHKLTDELIQAERDIRIARDLIARHGMSIFAKNRYGGGLRARVKKHLALAKENIGQVVADARPVIDTRAIVEANKKGG